MIGIVAHHGLGVKSGIIPIAFGFPLAADVVAASAPDLAERLRALAVSQSEGLLERAWEGQYFLRGFVDSGNPLAPQIFFLEPQVLPVLAGIADAARRDLALDAVVERLETPIGAVSNVAIAADGPQGGVDQPLIGGIWPVANAWLTGAYARRDPQEAWSSFVRNTLAAHAEAYPDLWYGIWSGPDSFNGPDSDRPGEADAHLATALTDYPALNAHVHTGPLRALTEIVGVTGTRDGLRITPRVPTETFEVRWPRLEIRASPERVEGSVTAAADGPIVMEIAVPARLRDAGTLQVAADDVAVPFSKSEEIVRFTLPGRADLPVAWGLTGSQ